MQLNISQSEILENVFLCHILYNVLMHCIAKYKHYNDELIVSFVWNSSLITDRLWVLFVLHLILNCNKIESENTSNVVYQIVQPSFFSA